MKTKNDSFHLHAEAFKIESTSRSAVHNSHLISSSVLKIGAITRMYFPNY